MSRNYRCMTIPGHIEAQFAAALDSRSIFSTFAGLTDLDAFVSRDGVSYAYAGMICTVTEGEDAGTFMLASLPTTTSANWIRLASSSLGNRLDYETRIISKPTLNNVGISGDLTFADLNLSFLTGEIVEELPPLEDARENVIYFSPAAPIEGLDQVDTDLYTESLLLIDEDGNRSYLSFGTVQTDFQNWYTEEETNSLATFTNDDSSSYIGYGNIPSGAPLNGVKMQDLVEKLFFAVVEPVVTEPSYSAKIVEAPTALMFTENYNFEVSATVDDGSIVTGGTFVSARTPGHSYPEEVIGVVPEEGSSLEIDLSCTFDAATEEVVKSDGSASELYSTYLGETVEVKHNIPLIGKIYKNGILMSGSDYTLEGNYLEVTTVLGDSFTFDLDYYRTVCAVEMLNSFTDKFELLGGSEYESLCRIDYTSDTEANTFTITNNSGGAILRFYVGDFEWYTTTETESYTIIGLTETAKNVINANIVSVMPALPEIDGDISLEFMFDGMLMTTVDISAFVFTNIVSIEGMFQNCENLISVTGFYYS